MYVDGWGVEWKVWMDNKGWLVVKGIAVLWRWRRGRGGVPVWKRRGLDIERGWLGSDGESWVMVEGDLVLE